MPLSRRRHDCAKPTWRPSLVEGESFSSSSCHTATRLNTAITSKPILSRRVAVRTSDEPCSKGRSFISWMFGLIRITRWATETASAPHLACRCCAKERRWGYGPVAQERASVHPQADRASDHLRRPSRDRDRERPPAQRTARIAAAADCDLGSAAGHQQFARRAATRIPNDAGERNPHL